MSNQLPNWSVKKRDNQGVWRLMHQFRYRLGKTRIAVRGFDHELSFGEVECADIEIIKKSHILATVLSAVILDSSCSRINYDHTKWTNPLKHRKIWTNAWSIIQVSDNFGSQARTRYTFDLAETIQWFYLDGHNNLGQSLLMPDIPNQFYFETRRPTN